MFFYRAVVFLFLDSISFVLAENAYIGLEQLVTNLVTIDNTDLVLISDFATESQVGFCNPLQIIILITYNILTKNFNSRYNIFFKNWVGMILPWGILM